MRLRFVALSLVVGCYAAHPRPSPDADELDAGELDAAGRLDVPGRFDAPVGGDAPELDAPATLRDTPAADAPACAPEDRVTTACAVSGTGSLPASRPFSLSLRWSSCRCEAARTCRVRVAGDLIEVDTENCRSDLPCDECSTESTCDMPALAPGPYRLVIDGIDTAALRVEPEPPRVSRPTCWELPAPPADALLCEPARDPALGAGTLCWRSVEDVGSNARLTFTAACRGCFDGSGGCRVVRDGTTLRVEPALLACVCPTCGACAEPCTAVEVACRAPALRDGRYTVVLQAGDAAREAGVLEVRDVAGPGPEVCADLGPP